jgi:hypothetical protein
MTAKKKPAADKKPQEPTRYQVLYEKAGGWVEYAVRPAPSAEQAIRQVVNAALDRGDEQLPGEKWKAVPVRSWLPPLIVKTEMVRKTNFVSTETDTPAS